MAHFIDDLVVENRLRSRSQITDLLVIPSANQTTQLVVGDQSAVAVTGSTLGQVVRLPDATTLVQGRRFEIFNQATVPITIQNNAGTLIGYMSANSRARIIAVDISTAAGSWYFDYNPHGLDRYYAAAAGPFTNADNTVFVSTASFTTGEIPAGDYRLEFSLLWSAAANNRGTDVQVLEGATVHDLVKLFAGPTGGTNGYYAYETFIRVTLAAGSRTIALQFRNNGAVGNTTITAINTRIAMYRLT